MTTQKQARIMSNAQSFDSPAAMLLRVLNTQDPEGVESGNWRSLVQDRQVTSTESGDLEIRLEAVRVAFVFDRNTGRLKGLANWQE